MNYTYPSITRQTFRIKSMLLLIILSLNIKSTHSQNVVWGNGITNDNNSIGISTISTDTTGATFIGGTFKGVVDFDPGPGVDTLNSLIVAFNNGAGYISKRDNAGNHLWVKAIIPQIGGPYSASSALIQAITISANGNIIVTGEYTNRVDFDPGPGIDSLDSYATTGLFVMTLDPNGNLIWVKTLKRNTTAAFYYPRVWPVSLKTDGNQDIIISGLFRDTIDFDPGPAVNNVMALPAKFSVFVLKLSSAGNFIWVKTIDTATGNVVNTLDIDQSNNIYLSGVCNNQTDLDPGPGIYQVTGTNFDLKLDSGGNFIWAHGNNSKNSMVHIAKNNELICAGQTQSNFAFITRYDTMGTQLWTKTLEEIPVPAAFGGVQSIATDSTGNIFLGGRLIDNPVFPVQKYYIYAVDTAGSFLWKKKSGQSVNSTIRLEINTNDDLMVAGSFGDLFDVDFGPGILNVGAANVFNGVFLMKYHYCGSASSFNYVGCDSLVLPDTTYLQSANYLKEYVGVNGCDSDVNIFVVLNPAMDSTMIVCDSAYFNGQYYTQSGNYNLLLPYAPGCDSTFELKVRINTPANQPAFMNLIQTLSDTVIAVYSVEVDSMFNIYLGGASGGVVVELGPQNGSEALVNRYDSAGNLIWRRVVDDASKNLVSPTICLGDTLQLHSSAMYMTQLLLGYAVFDPTAEGFTESFNFSMTYNDSLYWPLWADTKLIYEIFNDPASNRMVKICTVPNYGVPNTPLKVLVERDNNTFSFASPANAWGGGQCYPKAGTVDSQGNIYVSGSWQDAPIGPGIGQYGAKYTFIAKLDSNLNLLWNKLYPTGLSINRMKLDGNTLLICGASGTAIDLDLSPNIFYANGEGGTLLARFDTAANPIWATCYGALGGCSAKTLTTDLDGNIYIGGEFPSVVDLDPGPGFAIYNKACNNTDWDGGYVSKFNANGTFIRGMGIGKIIKEIEFKSPDRIYVAGAPSLNIYELNPDTTIYTYPAICFGDSILVGNSVYTQSGIYTNVFLSYLNTDSVVITNLTVHPLPMVLAIASDTVICAGDSVVLSGSGALTYNWNNGVVDNQIFSPAGSNSYVVTGTDTNGCVNTDSIQVLVNSLPVVLANASYSIVCFGDSIILFGSGALTYIWNNLVTDSALFAPLATGYFIVTGTDTNGCTNQDSIQVIVNALPLVMANASDTSLCIGDSLILFGSGALTYTWNNAITDSMIFMPTITNNYLVTGTDTNGCVNTDSITVAVNALPIVVANASDTSVCIGNPVILFGTGADSFSWTNSVIDSVAFYPIDTAMYVVTGIDLNGCIGQDSIEVITYQIPFPILVYSGDTLYCTNVSGVTYYWFKDTVAVDSLINYYVVTQNGNYEVLVVDSNGCVGADSISMLNIGYLTKYKSDLIKVYPNPTNGDINIAFEMKQAGDVDLTIIDLLGKKVYASKNKLLTSGNQRLKIDLTQYHLTTGIYFLNIIIDGKRNVVKFEYHKP
jgi:hypothetical protein